MHKICLLHSHAGFVFLIILSRFMPGDLVMSRMYPITRSIPILTSSCAPGVILASGNVGQTLQLKVSDLQSELSISLTDHSQKSVSVFLSADEGLSWHQVLHGNY